MKTRMVIVLCFMIGLSSAALGQQAKLEGHVYQILNGKELPVADIRVIAPGAQAQQTDRKGHFKLTFSTKTLPGRASRIEIQKDGWVIYDPLFGNCVTQSATLNYEPLKVTLIEKRSPLALAPKRLSLVIAQWANERTQLRGQVKELKSNLDEYAFLREYAEKYGFTLEQFRQAADQWALSKDADDKENQALKKYWQEDYLNAARLAHEAALETDGEVDRSKKEWLEKSRKSIRRFQLEGNAFYEQLKFREALKAYSEIENRFSARTYTKEDLFEEWGETKSLIGNAKLELGTLVEGDEIAKLLSEAVNAYSEALGVFTSPQLPQEWATLQNNLGVALTRQGEIAKNAKGLLLLLEAKKAFDAAFSVHTSAKLASKINLVF